MRQQSNRLIATVVVAALFVAAASTPAGRTADAGAALTAPPHRGDVRVIVQSVEGADRAATTAIAAAIVRAGGTVTLDLPLVNGVAATLPAAAIAPLAAVPGVRAISLDRPVAVQSGGGGAADSVYGQVVRADAAAAAGLSGAGVTVAVLDTGIADVPDLAGRVVAVRDEATGQSSPCLNLSGEPHCGDSYGHGTFVAGLIAGDGSSSAGVHRGVAPGARLVSIKVAGASGATDVSNVIAGIQWAVASRTAYGIKVLNLSLGTDGTQSYRTDPLNFAVERAWFSGIAVVVAASNRGPAAGTISKPGDDPWVITVGAIDDRGTPGLADDELPDFTSRGPTAADGLAKPDVVAPGARLVSLRAPGSAIDTQFPGTMGPTYRRGSGTSGAAGVVSGAVALALQANPSWSPDRVKYALTATARPSASRDPMAVGAGVVDAHAAALDAPAGTANRGLARSNGLGSLDGSRGSVRVVADDGGRTVVSGPLTGQLRPWPPLPPAAAPPGGPPAAPSSWYGSSWYGSSWYGSSWYGSSWYGSSWYGSSWYGSSWYGTPNGSSWYGSSWYGSSWYGAWD